MAHRIMTIEAIAATGWPVAGIAPRLRRHPAQIQQLTGIRQRCVRVQVRDLIKNTADPLL